jgi:hypothetical protein
MIDLDKEDKKELEELKKEIKKIREDEDLVLEDNLLERLEYNLNKLKEKIKNENKD